jgi:hypothetical protein
VCIARHRQHVLCRLIESPPPPINQLPHTTPATLHLLLTLTQPFFSLSLCISPHYCPPYSLPPFDSVCTVQITVTGWCPGTSDWRNRGGCLPPVFSPIRSSKTSTCTRHVNVLCAGQCIRLTVSILRICPSLAPSPYVLPHTTSCPDFGIGAKSDYHIDVYENAGMLGLLDHSRRQATTSRVDQDGKVFDVWRGWWGRRWRAADCPPPPLPRVSDGNLLPRRHTYLQFAGADGAMLRHTTNGLGQ